MRDRQFTMKKLFKKMASAGRSWKGMLFGAVFSIALFGVTGVALANYFYYNSDNGIMYFDTPISPTNYLYLNGNLAIQGTDSWLRLNQNNNFANGIYTPGAFRADGGITSGAVGSYGAGTIYATGNIYSAATVSANKVTANTFDPVYAIGGTNYATYLSGMTGVKEETAGTIMLQKGTNGTYQATINFAKEPTGSDLWLFAKATEMPSAMDQLAVLLTPSFDGNVWYHKDTAAGTLTIYGASAPGSMAAGAASGGYEVSYRLTAPRFDAAKWTNYGDPSAKGLLITP